MKVSGIQAIADFFQVSTKTIRNWRNDGAPIPKKYLDADLGEIQLWRAKYTKAGDGRQRDFYSPPTVEDKEFHELRKIKAEADRKERENRERLAELVEKKELEYLWVSRIVACKQGLMTLGRSLPPRLIHCQSEREMEIIILEAVRELLLAFSRPLPEALGGVTIDPDRV